MLMSDGGSGSSPVTGQTYTIKTEPVTPISVSGLTAQTIEAWFASIDASSVLQAGHAHTAASKNLNETAEGIIQHAQTMSQNWTGDAANAAVSNFKQLHAAAVSMAQVSHTVGQVLTQTAGVLQSFQGWKAPAMPSSVTTGQTFAPGASPQDQVAQQALQKLNDFLVTANAALPASITVKLPMPGSSSGSGTAPAAGGGSAGGAGSGGSAGTGGGGTGGGAPRIPGPGSPVTGTPVTGTPVAGSPGPTKLASGGTLTAPPPTIGGGTGTGPGGGLGSGPGGSGPGGGFPLAGAPLPGGGVGGPGAAGGVDGFGGGLAGPNAGGVGVLGAEGEGPGLAAANFEGATMGPGGTITSVQEGALAPDAVAAGNNAITSERGAMAAEDGMPMMGMGGAGGGGAGRSSERNRLAWLSEEADLWAGGTEPAAPPVIGEDR